MKLICSFIIEEIKNILLIEFLVSA